MKKIGARYRKHHKVVEYIAVVKAVRETQHRCYMRTITLTSGETITYRAQANASPETVALLDDLVRAVTPTLKRLGEAPPA